MRKVQLGCTSLLQLKSNDNRYDCGLGCGESLEVKSSRHVVERAVCDIVKL